VRISKNKEDFFEVKYQNRIDSKDFDFLLSYPAFKNKKITVITKDLYKKIKEIDFIPLEPFLVCG